MTSTDQAVPALDPDVLHELVAQVRAGERDVAELVQQLRDAQLVVEVDSTQAGHEVVAVAAQGLRWLPVFTALDHWAQFLEAAGRGDERVGYGWLSGAELFDEVLPQLPTGTGVVLDPTAEHVLALPPTQKGVSDE